ncbi:MAG: hypothetical protein WAS27_00910 [Candidatus Saccharimonadales bacterium]
MKNFAVATPPPKLKTQYDYYASLACAGLLTIMLVSQLFTFEETVAVMEGLGLSKVILSVIVSMELFALPFLLRMRLSPLMRIVSMTTGWVVAVAWLAIAITSLSLHTYEGVGLFGTVLPLPVGVVSMLYVLLLSGLLLWVTVAGWPLQGRSRATKK